MEFLLKKERWVRKVEEGMWGWRGLGKEKEGLVVSRFRSFYSGKGVKGWNRDWVGVSGGGEE